MAEWITVPSSPALQPQELFHEKRYFLIPNASNVLVCRGRFSSISLAKLTFKLKAYQLGGHYETLRKTSCIRKLRRHCACFATLPNLNYTESLDWAKSMDEVLLVISVIFAYMAGAVPQKGFNNAQTNTNNGSTSCFNSYGSNVKSENKGSSKNIWNEVEEKIQGALNVVEFDYTFGKRGDEAETSRRMHPLSLLAIDESPRLRLLSTTLKQLRNMVLYITEVHEGVDMDAKAIVTYEIIHDSVQPIFLAWLEGELSRVKIVHDKGLVNKLLSGFKGSDSIIENIRNSGKENLYADLIFYLRFGALRSHCKYDSKFVSQHGVGILEDLVVSLADGIASMYLKLISVDSNMCAEVNSIGLTFCSMTTRALQRMRNEVSFSRWMYQNIESVVAIYEDRFDLFTLQTKLITSTDSMQMKSFNWWKKLTFWQPTVTSPLCSVLIAQISLPVKRTMELRTLTGWRYYFSLFLEFADIAMPIVSIISSKVNNAVSFFLTCLIGRSLGLIYTGIRQALRWKQGQNSSSLSPLKEQVLESNS